MRALTLPLLPVRPASRTWQRRWDRPERVVPVKIHPGASARALDGHVEPEVPHLGVRSV